MPDSHQHHRPRPVPDSRFVTISTRRHVITATIQTPSIATREAPAISDAIVDVIEQEGTSLKYLVLDASKANFMNSMGLGMWIDLRNRVEAVGGVVLLVGLGDELRALLNTVAVDRLFRIVDDVTELAEILRA